MTAYRSFKNQSLHYFTRNHQQVPPTQVQTDQAWRRADFSEENWLEELSAMDIAEIDRAVTQLQNEGTALEQVSRDNFPLPSLGNRIQNWRAQIQQGCGFVVVKGLPVKEWGHEKSAYAYWGLGHHLGIPGAQNPANELLGHVIDYDEEKNDANVRRYRTSGNIDFHCDAADVVGLLCLHAAKSGGQSRIASTLAIYNEIYARHPELIQRLFQPFYLDRRGEQKEGQAPYMPITPCAWNEKQGLQTFYHSEYFRSAERHDEVEIDSEARSLLDLFDELCASPEYHLDMWLEPGDMQFISNHTIVHARTEYEDWPEKDKKRHLLRLWLSL